MLDRFIEQVTFVKNNEPLIFWNQTGLLFQTTPKKYAGIPEAVIRIPIPTSYGLS